MNASLGSNLETGSARGTITERGQCLLVKLEPRQLLVPRVLVAEVVRHDVSALVATAHRDIRLFSWRGFRVPVLNAAVIHADCVQASGEDSKIVVFYGLSNQSRLPYYGVVASRNPRVVMVTEANVQPCGDQQQLPAAQGAVVTVGEDNAIIPKVDYLEKFILDSGVIHA